MQTVPRHIKIFSAAPYFYNLKKDVGYTVQYIVRMNDEIDPDALKKAFEATMNQYPYLRLKLVKGLFSDHLEYNDAPLVVLNTSEALTLGQEQTNGHLLALTYKRRSIYINNSHGIMDGRGRAPFMKKLPKRKHLGPGVSMPAAMKLSKMGLGGRLEKLSFVAGYTKP